MIPPDEAPGQYVLNETLLAGALDALSTADRARRIEDYLTDVQAEWKEAEKAGLITALKKVRAKEKDMANVGRSSGTELQPGVSESTIPVYREYLMLDAGGAASTRLGRDLVSGSVAPADSSASGATAADAIMQLRRLSDTLQRALICDWVAKKTGLEFAIVAALYRVEGDMMVMPSRKSIQDGIPPGRSDYATSIWVGGTYQPEISHGLLMRKWLHTTEPGALMARFPVDELSGGKTRGFDVNEDSVQTYYDHTERGFPGGYFPLGANTLWHGGLHLHAGASTVFHAIDDGTIIAARIAEEALANKKYGSTNFILLKHRFITETLSSEDYYCLFMHLHWETLGASNKALESFPWLLLPDGKLDGALLNDLKVGDVVSLSTPVKAGDALWTVGSYGQGSHSTPLIHWEVFSPGPIHAGWAVVEDPDADLTCDAAKISALLAPNGPDTDADGEFERDELIAFYRDPARCAPLRKTICRFLSEHDVDWNTAVDKLKGRWFTSHLPNAIGPYLFWKDAVAAGVPMPSSSHVHHHNGIAFLEEKQRLIDQLRIDGLQLLLIQIGGLDQLVQASVADQKKEFVAWSKGNWAEAGLSGSAADAKRRWDDLLGTIVLEEKNSVGGGTTALLVQTEDPTMTVAFIVQEAAVLFSRLREGGHPAGSSLIEPHPLEGTQLPWSVAYALYNGGPRSFQGCMLSLLVSASKQRAFKKLRKAIADSSALSSLVTPLQSTIAGLKRDAVIAKAQANWATIKTWLTSDDHLELVAVYLEGAGTAQWRGWADIRGNVARFVALREYYKKL